MNFEKGKIKEDIIQFYNSDEWKELIPILERGEDVIHAHVYEDTSVHPQALMKIVEGYFDKIGWGLTRKIKTLPQPAPTGPMANLYGIHSPGKAHFEIILNLTPNAVIAPRKEKSHIEFWDKDFIAKVHEQFDFREITTKEDEKAIRDYFTSYFWQINYDFVRDPTNIHAHSVVQTSVHPDVLIKYGWEAIESNGFTMQKAISFPYYYKGERKKVVFMTTSPETFMEFEWDFNPDVIITPSFNCFTFVYNQRMLDDILKRCDFLVNLDNNDIADILQNIEC